MPPDYLEPYLHVPVAFVTEGCGIIPITELAENGKKLE
jgi:hypothetical protein